MPRRYCVLSEFDTYHSGKLICLVFGLGPTNGRRRGDHARHKDFLIVGRERERPDRGADIVLLHLSLPTMYVAKAMMMSAAAPSPPKPSSKE